MYSNLKFPRYLAILSTIAILSACGSQQLAENDLSRQASVPAPQNPEVYLSLASQAQNNGARSAYLLKAASAYYDNNLPSQARAALNDVDYRFLQDSEWQSYWLLKFELALMVEDKPTLEETLAIIHSPTFFQSNISMQHERLEQLERAYSVLDQPIKAAQLLIENTNLLKAAPRDINEQIWKRLRQAELSDLGAYVLPEDHYDTRGWIALARAIRLNSLRLQDQYLALQEWIDAWDLHPAASDLPKELQLLLELPESRPRSIVLALPFSGALAPVSEAIRDGILASYYAHHDSDDSTSLSSGDPISITTFDTHTRDFFSLYDGHLADNSIIIGPLQKSTLARLLESDALPVKTLALNYVSSERAVENLYQFSLNPEDETRQVAQRLREEGHERIGILAPESDWGLRVYDSFNLANVEFDNTLIESAFYGDQKTLSPAVAKVLATDLSKARTRTVTQITGIPLDSVPRRRQDIDAVFMVAKADIAKQLKPLLAYHYASNLPVYATSQINDLDNQDNLRDLNGIRFVDMPWSLSATIGLRRTLEEQFPQKASNYSRFHAMGVDAFQITPRLELLSQIEDSHIEGQTGELSIGNDNVVRRKLQWATFKSGKPIIIN